MTGDRADHRHVTKTLEGAWIVLILIPMIVAVFKATRRHYDNVASQLTLRGYTTQPRIHNTVLMPIGGIQRAVVEALRYAETLSDDVRAMYVDVDRGVNRAAAPRLGSVGRQGEPRRADRRRTDR